MVAVIRYRHAPVRIKLPRIVEIDELFQLGIRLMESADRRQACRRRQVLQYRNGLIISILAVTFLRREDLSRLCIGQHLVRNKGEWRINIAPSKSRNRRPTPMVFLIPGELTVFVDEYIARCRLALLAMRRRGVSPCDAGNALWIGDDGGPLRYDAIYEIVTRITEQEFGRSVYPHLFRDCSASSTVTRDPEHVGIIPHLLGHKTSATSERHYIHARSYEAARLWQANWLARANEPADPGS
jgi:integrase